MKRTFITASLVIFLSTNLLGSQANADVAMREVPSCATWAEARSEDSVLAVVWEAYLLGTMNGIALATDKDFWKVGGGITNDQAYFWMDRYCDNNPLKDVADGAITLWFERFPE